MRSYMYWIFFICYIVLCFYYIQNYVDDRHDKLRKYVCLTRDDLEILINSKENNDYTQDQLHIMDKIGY